MEQELTDHDVIELERRAREMTSLIFALRIKAHPGLPTPELTALAASAMSLQKALAAFLAIEKLCE